MMTNKFTDVNSESEAGAESSTIVTNLIGVPPLNSESVSGEKK